MTIDFGAWWDRLVAAMQHPAFHAAVLALLVGIALTEALAHLLPGQMRTRTAERMLRVVVLIVVATLGYMFHRTIIGAGWALTMGLAAPSVHNSLQLFAYERWPFLRPKALR